MKKNINTTEAHVRTLASIALLLITLLLVENAILKIILALASAILATTAFLRHCPLYRFQKKNTFSEKEEHEGEIPPPTVSVPAEEGEPKKEGE